MDWLRCNRCYKAFFIETRSFSMTQCGHVYCSLCIDQMGKKCRECGATDFKLMPLTKPPKLETMINYFSPLDDFMELSSKAAYFQENQMMIAVRAASQTEKKYSALKTEHSKVMNEIKELQIQCQKVYEEIKKMKRARESLRYLHRNDPVKRDINSKDNSRYFQASTNWNASSVSTVSEKYRETPRIFGASKTEEYKKTPKYPYNPNPAFSNVSYHSAGTTSDSSRSSVIGTSGGRVGGFLIPNVQRVPKSAATIKRKTPTGVRMSVPNDEKDF